MKPPYRGRIAPSPTGFLHLGHAATFWTAFERAQQANGKLVLRNDDLDTARCRTEFIEAMIDDLHWWGISWHEGPDVGGPHGPYNQSERRDHYLHGWQRLRDGGFIYPCSCSRRDILAAAGAPHAGDDETIYPGFCRPANTDAISATDRAGVSWRFRVPDGEEISFVDERVGLCRYIAGKDFGDFVVWRKDDVPSYQIATVLDDAAMEITEVVRGEDLLLSTARQLLLYLALGLTPPKFYHCPLITDTHGERLAKRHESLSLRALRETGASPVTLRATTNPK